MTDRELSIALREMARVQKKPLCDKWYGQWDDDTDVDGLLDMYVRGFDFVQENDYPPLDFIRRNFKKEDLHRHNIYVDESVVIDDAQNGYYVFLGDTKATVVADGFKAVTVYCRHDSEVNVRAMNGARVFVTFYEQSSGVCKSDEMSKIKKYIYHKSKK